jgi:hypothetical protein
MTKYLILACFLPFSLFAQPSITSSVHGPKIGQTQTLISFSAGENENIDVQPGEAGINKDWNFSALKTGVPMMTTYIDPNTLKLKDEIQSLDVNIGSKLIDSSGITVTLLKVTEQELISKGLTNDTFIIKAIPSPLLMKFPFTFGNKFVSNSGLRFGDSLEFFTVNSFMEVEADAYGAITTADGSFNNVLRVKSTSFDTIVLTFGEDFSFSFIDTTINYQWFAQDNPAPVFSLSGFYLDGAILFDGYSYLSSKTTSLTSTNLESVTIYPNPFQDNITIEGPIEIGEFKMQIFNSSGQQIIEKSMDSDQSPNLNLSYLPKGNYIIQISNKTNYIKSFKVTKI